MLHREWSWASLSPSVHPILPVCCGTDQLEKSILYILPWASKQKTGNKSNYRLSWGSLASVQVYNQLDQFHQVYTIYQPIIISDWISCENLAFVILENFLYSLLCCINSVKWDLCNKSWLNEPCIFCNTKPVYPHWLSAWYKHLSLREQIHFMDISSHNI